MARGQTSEQDAVESRPLHQQLSSSRRSFRRSSSKQQRLEEEEQQQRLQEQAPQKQKQRQGDDGRSTTASGPTTTRKTQSTTLATSNSLQPPMRKISVSPLEKDGDENDILDHDDDDEYLCVLPPQLQKQASIDVGGGSTGDYAMKYFGISSSPNTRKATDNHHLTTYGFGGGGGGGGGFNYYNDTSSVFSSMSSSSHRRKDWTCVACSYHNVDKYNDQCALCGTLKKEEQEAAEKNDSSLSSVASMNVSQPTKQTERKSSRGLFNRRQQTDNMKHPPSSSSSSLGRPKMIDPISSPEGNSMIHARSDHGPPRTRKSSLGLFTRRKSDNATSPSSPSSHSQIRNDNNNDQTGGRRRDNPLRRRPSAGSVGIQQFVTENATDDSRRTRDSDGDDKLRQSRKQQQQQQQQQALNKQYDYHQDLQPPPKPMSKDRLLSSEQRTPSTMQDDSSSVREASSIATGSIANGSVTTIKVSNLQGQQLRQLQAVVPSSPARSVSPLSFSMSDMLFSHHSDRRPKATEPPPVTPEHGMRGGRLVSVGGTSTAARSGSALLPIPSPSDSDDDDDEPNLFFDKMAVDNEDREYPSSSYLPHSIGGVTDPTATAVAATYFSATDPSTNKNSSTVSVASGSSRSAATSSQIGGLSKPYHATTSSKKLNASPRNSYNLSSTQHTVPTQYSSYTETSHDSVEVEFYQPSSNNSDVDTYRYEGQEVTREVPEPYHVIKPRAGAGGMTTTMTAPPVMTRSPFSISNYEDDEYYITLKKRKRLFWIFIVAVIVLGAVITTSVVVAASKRRQDDLSHVSITEDSLFPTGAPIKSTVAAPTVVNDAGVYVTTPPPARHDDIGRLELLAIASGASGMDRFGTSVDFGGEDRGTMAVAGNSFVRILQYQPDGDPQRFLLRHGSNVDKNPRRVSSTGSLQQLGNDIPTNSAAPLISLASQLASVGTTSDVDRQVVAVSQHQSLMVFDLQDPNSDNRDSINAQGGDDHLKWQLVGTSIPVGRTNVGVQGNMLDGSHRTLGSAVSLSRGGTRVASGAVVDTTFEESKSVTTISIQVYDYKDGTWESVFRFNVDQSHIDGDVGGNNTSSASSGYIDDIQMQLSDAGDTLAVLVRRSIGGSQSVLIYPLEDKTSSQSTESITPKVDPVPWQLSPDAPSEDYYYTAMALSGHGNTLVVTSTNKVTHVFGFSQKDGSGQKGSGRWDLIDTIEDSGGASVSISDAGHWIAIGNPGSKSAGKFGSVSLYALPSSTSNEGAKYQLMSRMIEPSNESVFGKSVAVSNQSLAVGAPLDQQHGAVYLYKLPDLP